MVEKIALTVEEARRLSGVGRNRLFKEIHAGALPVIKIGNKPKFLILREELEKWLRAQSVGSAN